jgi:SNF2 family DNA or RNA helicase
MLLPLTPQGTVEDRILALQEAKRQVVSAALNEEGRADASQTGTRLSFEELKYLFGVGAAPPLVGSRT